MNAGMIRGGLLGGVLAPVLWAVVIIIAGQLRPGFDHLGQYISELGERGSSTQFLMRYGGFVASGLLHIAYAAAFFAVLSRLTERHRLSLLVALLIALNGLGRIGAGLFACEPGCAAPEVLNQRLHSLSATVAFLAIAAAALLGAILFWSQRRLRPLAAYSLASGVAGLIFLVLMSASASTHFLTGLYERLASGIFSLWILVGAVWLVRLGETAMPGDNA
jgi:hypothetical membrane protein